MLKKIKGNLFDLAESGQFDVVVHGCNCFNTMGSGIALEVRNRYSGAWRVDQYTDSGDIMKLGNWTEYHGRNFTIINAYTQFDYNRADDTTDRFEYSSFEVILTKLLKIYGADRIGFPYIGMNRAGGDKDRIMSMLENFAEKVSAKGGSVTLVEFEQ